MTSPAQPKEPRVEPGGATTLFKTGMFESLKIRDFRLLWISTLCATFAGLSKIYRACGYRIGWMTFSGDREHADDNRQGEPFEPDPPAEWPAHPEIEQHREEEDAGQRLG